MPTVEIIETEILRRMTPEQKLAVVHALWVQAWNLRPQASASSIQTGPTPRCRTGFENCSVTQAPDLIRLLVVPLNALDVPYMVTGAVAAAVYGEPQFTRDLDLVLALRPSDAARFASAFSADAFYVPPREAIIEQASRDRDGHFNVIHHDTALKADCYLAAADPLHTWALERRSTVEVGGVPVDIAPLE